MELFHTYRETVCRELSVRFNNPFYYLPHPLCVAAAEDVRAFLRSDEALAAETAKGKMFGVLVVEDRNGKVGYLAAFSGLLFGKNHYKGFVPPIYDMQSPSGHFKQEEAAISALNRKIEDAECDAGYRNVVGKAARLKQAMDEELAAMRENMRVCKQRRGALRATGALSSADEALLIRESQYQKAELKRTAARWQQRISEHHKIIAPYNAHIAEMKEERKRRSAVLQEWLFTQFKVLNGRGEEKTLLAIFGEKGETLPPAGAGECAAPKLLQYAYSNRYRPVAMAEFWVGESPAGEVRCDGCFYGSCKSKCEPILGFMLQGIDVEDDALEKGGDIDAVEVVYEDEYLVVVNKPPGVLSVPGLVGGTSVQQWLRERQKSNDVYMVHRLDMATSGLLVAAKSMEVYKELQRSFASREVGKKYLALLGGVPERQCGRIEIPLAPDYDNRPRQKVDYSCGKDAITDFKVLETFLYGGKECALVELEPLTGRTHQLRVHSACTGGIGVPIVGDAIYGTAGKRLMLHAASIEFIHPVSKRILRVEKDASFDI